MTNQTTNARALQAGTILNNQYTIEGILGEGGFGITYLGFDRFLKIKVAIKEYFPAQFATRDTVNGNNTISIISGERTDLYQKGLQDYEYEANRLTKFAHLSGIVSVLNFFYENNTAYMVMEFVEGITLKQYLKEHRGRIGWRETLEMMQPVINSLKAVHSAGIIHRDISPDNIMISEHKKITIIDFGAARNEEDEKSKTIMLKKGYAPPEQYFKKGNQGPWTDVYALCATIYRMITGVKLPESLAVRVGNAQYEPIHKYAPDIPKSIEKALFRGLAVEIEERISSMQELEDYLYKGSKLGMSAGQKRKIAIGVCSMVAMFAVFLIGNALLSNVNIGTDRDDESSTEFLEDDEDEESTDMESGEELMESTGAEEEYTVPEYYTSLEVVDSAKITYVDNGDSLAISSLATSVTDAAIPTSINGKQVTEINGVGTNVTSLYLPEGIEKLGQNAFKNCVYLERIYLPETLSEIADGAFDNCQSLELVELAPDNQAFYMSNNTLYRNDGTSIVSW